MVSDGRWWSTVVDDDDGWFSEQLWLVMVNMIDTIDNEVDAVDNDN